ncbi:MAG: Holliday junction branch migration protein RuvA [Anaerolineaceae bacterium]|nr:Holliday junction branch migration protein RuvA [Anaerolineaceae bacterium]
MIASLRGILSFTSKDFVVLDVGGVGFQVFVPPAAIGALGSTGDEILLFTHLQVRENEMALYGFRTEEELATFRLVQTVTGIGPRVALALLSALTPERFRAAIAQEDVAALGHVPGIGPKTARKLVFDLKDKVGEPAELGVPSLAAIQADADLIAALTSLGYSVAEAQEAIRNLPREPLALEEKVRLALAYFAS